MVGSTLDITGRRDRKGFRIRVEVAEVGGGSDDEVTIDTSSESPVFGVGGDSSTASWSTGEPGVICSFISIRAGSGLEDGVGDAPLAGNVFLRGLQLSAAEGDTEEGLAFAWDGVFALSGVGEEVSQGGCCSTTGELDTSDAIAGE